jgi:hypothetical protein
VTSSASRSCPDPAADLSIFLRRHDAFAVGTVLHRQPAVITMRHLAKVANALPGVRPDLRASSKTQTPFKSPR